MEGRGIHTIRRAAGVLLVIRWRIIFFATSLLDIASCAFYLLSVYVAFRVRLSRRCTNIASAGKPGSLPLRCS